MAPKFTDKENLDFVCCCIKHSNNGICNFRAVSDELGLVSKDAAEKRFGRIMHDHGITGGLRGMAKKVEKPKKEASPDDKDIPHHPAGIDPKRGRPSKKRKLQQVMASTAGDVDEPSVKGEVKSEDAIHVKSELGNTDRGGYVNWPGPTADDDDIIFVGALERNPASTSVVTANRNPGLPDIMVQYYPFDLSANTILPQAPNQYQQHPHNE